MVDLFHEWGYSTSRKHERNDSSSPSGDSGPDLPRRFLPPIERFPDVRCRTLMIMPDLMDRNLGVQPLDTWMRERDATNHDLVAASPHPLTHKAVQRARKGRRLTRRTQLRIVEAVNAFRPEDPPHLVTDLFTYQGTT